MTLPEARTWGRQAFLGGFDLHGHPDDRYWARPSDLAGVGFLRLAEVQGDRTQVEVRVRNLTFYLDTTILASIGDLANLRDITLGARVAFSGSVRSITERGVRLGRLNLHPCAVEIEKAVLTPTRDAATKTILFGEVAIPDPDPGNPSFLLFLEGNNVRLGAREAS